MTVNGLSPGVSYTFYLAAGNAVGIGTAVKFRVRTPRRVSHNHQSGNNNSNNNNNNNNNNQDDSRAIARVCRVHLMNIQ